MTAYYNEFDPKAAAWLRELIRRGLIADGVVDERSILDVQPDDLLGFTQCHFFAGIGGWSLALRLSRWSDDRPVWTGSPPCQPFSAAGRRKGKSDERHLAPHFAALVAECRPGTLFGEQVASAAVFGKASSGTRKAADGNAAPEWAWLDDLFERLEAAHYACGASDIPAAGVGAAHIRQRTFFGAVRLENPELPPVARQRPVSGAGLRIQETGGLARASHSDGLDAVARRAGMLCREDGGLANARHLRGRDGAEPKEPQHDAASGRNDGLGGLADPASTGLEGQRRSGGSRAGNDRRAGEFFGAPHGGDGGLADADAGSEGVVGRSGAGLCGGAPGVAWAGPRRSGEVAAADAADLGWPSVDWLYCRDGKWRPVGPGTFPLAHGVSARVGRLRGYGNAIVPQAAAEFIKAFDAASAECFRLTDLSETTTDNEGVFG